MPKGNGLAKLNADLVAIPPNGGTAVMVGVDLYADLYKAKRITDEKYHPTGMPSYDWNMPTLDKKYPIIIGPNLAADEYEYRP